MSCPYICLKRHRQVGEASLAQFRILDFGELSCWFDSFSQCLEGRLLARSLWEGGNPLLSERVLLACGKPALGGLAEAWQEGSLGS